LPIELNSTHAQTQIKDQIAVTRIEQEFYNPNSRQLEGTFLFPVPKGAHLDKFKMDIDGKMVEAELMTAEKARGIFEEIVRKLRDPALLEYSGRDVFKVRIFPIEPHGRKRVTVEYTQLLKSDSGLMNFILPLNAEKQSTSPLKSFSMKVDLETSRPLKAIYSPTHKVEIRRDGSRKATVGFEGSDLKSEADFQLFFSQEENEVGLDLLTYKPAGEDGYFLLLASPGVEAKRTKSVPKDVVFVLDTSGSMAGNKLEQAKKALLFCVENLNEQDRFEVMRFSTEVEPLFDKLAAATDESRARARQFITDLKPIGGTAIDDALRKSLSLRPDKGDRPFLLIFLTDGRPTVGTTDENQIVDNVSKANHGNTRVFCFGIGTDVNTHLLDKITEETKAFSQYVLPEEDIELKVSSFYTKIKEPALANPKVIFPEGVRVAKLYPSPVPDLFKGEQLVLVGRYSKSADGALRIEGTVNGEKRQFTYDASMSDDTRHEFIPRLWATRRVGYLLDEIRLRGESRELKEEVTELARKYNIVTPYTAYLIMEDETHRQVPTVMRSLRFDDQRRAVFRSEFDALNQLKDGDTAVAGARSTYNLKIAEAPTDAIRLGREEALRGSVGAPAAPPGLGAGGSPRYGASTGPTVWAKRESTEMAAESRFVGGRAFYRNGAQWVDSQVQNMPAPTRKQIEFGSPEYFQLLNEHPEAASWMALGRELQLVVGNVVYEIHQ